jgi:hypothetical protein
VPAEVKVHGRELSDKQALLSDKQVATECDRTLYVLSVRFDTIAERALDLKCLRELQMKSSS